MLTEKRYSQHTVSNYRRDLNAALALRRSADKRLDKLRGAMPPRCHFATMACTSTRCRLCQCCGRKASAAFKSRR
ncbi:MAG: site-specific integrase [Pseudomonadota bacterium]